MTHPHYLKMYENLLRVDGAFYLKHDNRDFFHWSLSSWLQDNGPSMNCRSICMNRNCLTIIKSQNNVRTALVERRSSDKFR